MKYTCISRALALTVALLLAAASLFGCASSSDSGASASYGGSAYTPQEPASSVSANYDLAGAGFDTNTSTAEAVTVSGGSSAVSSAEIEQKLIYTVDLYIETLNYDSSLSALDALVDSVGGYVENSTIENRRISGSAYQLRYAWYTLRIPSDRLDEFERSVGDVGSVYESNRSTENATARYIDLTARLKTLKIEEETLQELLAAAVEMETIVTLTSRISEVRYEIETIESSLRNIDSLVSYSTVNITLSEVLEETEAASAPPVTFGERVSAASSSSFESFSRRMQNLGVFLFGELPLGLLWFIINLLPFAVIVLIIFLIVRARMRRHGRWPERKRGGVDKTEDGPGSGEDGPDGE